MTHIRELNNDINHIHKKSLRIVNKRLLHVFRSVINCKEKTVTIRNRNLQQLATDIFKIKIKISPVKMKEMLSVSDNKNYNLRSGTHLSRTVLHTTHYGSIKNLGTKIWRLVRQNSKEANSLSSFINKVKKWITKKCPYRLCKTYIAQVVVI